MQKLLSSVIEECLSNIWAWSCSQTVASTDTASWFHKVLFIKLHCCIRSITIFSLHFFSKREREKNPNNYLVSFSFSRFVFMYFSDATWSALNVFFIDGRFSSKNGKPTSFFIRILIQKECWRILNKHSISSQREGYGWPSFLHSFSPSTCKERYVRRNWE